MLSLASRILGWEPSPTSTDEDAQNASAPFEGPEKLLEIWFAPSAETVPDSATAINGKSGLRKINRSVWEEMLDIVKCKVLSYIEGDEMDAYLLSESSFFVSPHKLILKTCGTTLNLYGLPRILEIARTQAGFSAVHRCFYSRKAFMFPERQLGPHRDWKTEVEYLDNIFPNGAAYTVGKVNGDHWLLYMTTPAETEKEPSTSMLQDYKIINNPNNVGAHVQDYTIEILMSELSLNARSSFYSPPELIPGSSSPSTHAQTLSSQLGITDIFPPALTTLDAYAFTPCGYSANALLKRGGPSPANAHASTRGEGYYTIHVTPEEGWSYASFECNVPLATHATATAGEIPDLVTLIRRVVGIFQPGRLSLSLFIASADGVEDDEAGETAVEGAQRGFKTALSVPPVYAAKGKMYKRTDKINYEFGGYDLAFASFELR